MAWIEERRRTDGGVSARVMWRLGGRRGAPREKETFSAGSDAQNRARADGFKQMVDAAGQHWPDGWVKGEGFVRVRAEVRHLAPPGFAAVGEEYVRQIVDLSPGQRKRYLAQIWLLADIEVRGVRIFSRTIDAIAERGAPGGPLLPVRGGPDVLTDVDHGTIGTLIGAFGPFDHVPVCRRLDLAGATLFAPHHGSDPS